jgi:hypothetical protein
MRFSHVQEELQPVVDLGRMAYAVNKFIIRMPVVWSLLLRIFFISIPPHHH